MTITIRKDDLSDGNIVALLDLHRQEMLKHSPPENVHALTKQQLQDSSVTFWSAWIEDSFAGCSALKQLSEQHGEIKSMKIHPDFLRRGIAMKIMDHIISEARQRGYQQLSLETGTQAVFEPARQLYHRLGFEDCPPFADYPDSPFSVCMTLDLPILR